MAVANLAIRGARVREPQHSYYRIRHSRVGIEALATGLKR